MLGEWSATSNLCSRSGMRNLQCIQRALGFRPVLPEEVPLGNHSEAGTRDHSKGRTKVQYHQHLPNWQRRQEDKQQADTSPTSHKKHIAAMHRHSFPSACANDGLPLTPYSSPKWLQTYCGSGTYPDKWIYRYLYGIVKGVGDSQKKWSPNNCEYVWHGCKAV